MKEAELVGGNWRSQQQLTATPAATVY